MFPRLRRETWQKKTPKNTKKKAAVKEPILTDSEGTREAFFWGPPRPELPFLTLLYSYVL